MGVSKVTTAIMKADCLIMLSQLFNSASGPVHMYTDVFPKFFSLVFDLSVYKTQLSTKKNLLKPTKTSRSRTEKSVMAETKNKKDKNSLLKKKYVY